MFNFWLHAACRILAPTAEVELMSPRVEASSPNILTTNEFYKIKLYLTSSLPRIVKEPVTSMCFLSLPLFNERVYFCYTVFCHSCSLGV